MKKFTFAIVSLMFFLIASTPGASASESTSSEENVPEVQFRQIISLIEFGIEDSVDEELLQEMVDASSVTGWMYNEPEMQFERYVSYDSVEVSIFEQSDTENNLRRSSADDTVTVNIEDNETGVTYSQTISSDSQDTVIVFDLDISDMITMEDESINAASRASKTDPYWSDGETGKEGYKLHCNRWNGYKGNGKYYKNKLAPQAILNFYTSDCDWALGKSTKCLADYGKNPFCAASPASKQGACSGLIGHSKTYHKHTGNKS